MWLFLVGHARGKSARSSTHGAGAGGARFGARRDRSLLAEPSTPAGEPCGSAEAATRRNREKWELYQAAAADMTERTSTRNAPWTLVEANDKKYARVKVLETICKRIEEALDKL